MKKTKITTQAQEITNQLISWRREFHKHPELGFHELRTAARVAEEIERLGYRVRNGVGRTGVVAEKGDGHPIVVIRADMDALPLQEANNVPYASEEPGVMHACGHDAHTAIALGTARLLTQNEYPGTVRFLFQPAEEVADEDGLSGAARMIEDGAMDGVDATLALHVDSSVPVGEIRVSDGPSSAGVDTFYAKIIGRGGHGAAPHKVVDPIHIAGHVILLLNGIVSRRLHPIEPAVVSLGSIHGGQATNVIPESVTLSGTIRYMNPEVQKQIHVEIERALSIAQSLGGDYELNIEIGYPPMYNDGQVVHLIEKAARRILGEKHVKAPKGDMGAEDFGFFSNLAPGAMFMLGCRIERDERKHHSPRFDIDEACLPVGAAVMTEAALMLLKQDKI
jgi:amidohydrolase